MFKYNHFSFSTIRKFENKFENKDIFNQKRHINISRHKVKYIPNNMNSFNTNLIVAVDSRFGISKNMFLISSAIRL